MSISIPAFDGEPTDTPNCYRLQSYWINRGCYGLQVMRFKEDFYKQAYIEGKLWEHGVEVVGISLWPFECNEIVSSETWTNKVKCRPDMFPYNADIVTTNKDGVIVIKEELYSTKFEQEKEVTIGCNDFRIMVEACKATYEEFHNDVVRPIVGSVYREG